jgi:hypothetical protein
MARISPAWGNVGRRCKRRQWHNDYMTCRGSRRLALHGSSWHGMEHHRYNGAGGNHGVLTCYFIVRWHCCIVRTRVVSLGVVVVVIALLEWSNGCIGVVQPVLRSLSHRCRELVVAYSC